MPLADHSVIGIAHVSHELAGCVVTSSQLARPLDLRKSVALLTVMSYSSPVGLVQFGLRGAQRDLQR